MKKTFLLCALLAAAAAQAQTPTFSADIATIMYENCATCHHAGGIGPFELVTYSDAVFNAAGIQTHINDGHMPPWPPDSDYQTYAHDRSLTDAEKTLINDWVNGGMPVGDTANIPTPPVFNGDAFLTATPDLTLTMPVYTSHATGGNDDYITISIPTGLTTDRYLKAMEIIPGNSAIVHHILVFADDAGTYPTDTTSGQDTGPSSNLIYAYAPGGQPLVYPNDAVKMGFRIKAGSNIVLAIHYPDGSGGETDQSSVNLFFYDEAETSVRRVNCSELLQDWAFCIDPDTVETVSDVYPTTAAGLTNNYSFLSIFPHAHLLGKEYWVYAVTPAHDTIKLVHIPQWDFHWQGFYSFKNILKIPQGSKLYGRATYDNTSANLNNPNAANPVQVCAGLNTSDEMFIVYFQYLTYAAGDENINLEDAILSATTKTPTPDKLTDWRAYPNPFSQEVTFEYELDAPSLVRLSIYNLQGQLVETIADAEQSAGGYKMNWAGYNASGTSIPAGLYLAQLQIGEQIMTKKIVLQR